MLVLWPPNIAAVCNIESLKKPVMQLAVARSVVSSYDFVMTIFWTWNLSCITLAIDIGGGRGRRHSPAPFFTFF